MAVDPELLATIARAVEEVPDNTAMRLHLAELLCEDGAFDESLDHIQIVLGAQPASIDALTLAHRVATEAGRIETALGYQRLLASLGAGPEVDPTPAAPGTSPRPASPVDPFAPAPRRPLADPRGSVPPPATPPPATPFTDRRDGTPPSPSPGDQFIDDPFAPDGLPDLETPRLTLADVAGMADVKHRIEISFLAPARDPELRAAFRKSLTGGLLLYGPPGCGKTFIARALAGELRSHFLNVGIADVLDVFIGSSEANLHSLFQMARRHAPCVLFLDEIDALGQRRSHLRYSPGMRNVVNQMLSELDGADADNEGVYVLATSNQPWDIDPALRRPGRFDRTVFVAPPDYDARVAILDKNLRQRPLDAPIDLSVIAQATEGWSGADLVLICETATEYAMERSMQTGTVAPITQGDLAKARKLGRPTTTAWLDTARNVTNYANEGGDYDDLAAYLKRGRRR